MVTVQGSLSYRSGLWFVLLVVVLLICAQPAAALGINYNNYYNGLGLLAKTCAESFCRSGVQGLDLWISLEETCIPMTQPSFGMMAAKPTSLSSSVQSQDGDWSFFTTIAVCAGVWAASMYAGYHTGSKIGSQAKAGYPVV